MKSFNVFLLLFLFLFTITAQEDNTLTPEEFAKGWELLFDGKSLKEWKAYNGDTPKSWFVKESAIYCDAAKGKEDLMTVEVFGDFDLMFEWKISEKGNSGIIYRVREGDQWEKSHQTGAEYQLLDEFENFSKTSVGSLYDVYPPSSDKKLNPAMEWNSGRIRMVDGLITHWVNDIMVLQCQIGSNDWNTHVSGSKWKDNPFFMKSSFGHIAFQNHGSDVWFKNVKIMRIT